MAENSKIEWTDATSYSQGERGRISPKAWSIRIDNTDIWIGTGHRNNPGRWTMHCQSVGLDTEDIGLEADAPKEEAQSKALRIVQQKMRKLVDDMERTIAKIASLSAQRER